MFHLKRNYWLIRSQNYRFVRAIESVDKTIQTIEIYLSTEAKMPKKLINHSDLYYSVLASSIKELEIKELPSEEQKIEMRKLLAILEK